MRIRELAVAVGVSTDTVRFYGSNGRMEPSELPEEGDLRCE